MKKSLGAKTIVYPTPVFIVGTYDGKGKPNAMNAAWGGICCSKPPCIAVSLRRATYTYGCIVEKKAFTINIPSEAHVKVADYLGIASGKDRDKFEIAGLTPVRATHVDAPIIKEFPLALECKLIHTIEIGLHTQFIGEIMDVIVDEEMLDAGGKPDITKIKPIIFAPDCGTYHGFGPSIGKAFSIGNEI